MAIFRYINRASALRVFILALLSSSSYAQVNIASQVVASSGGYISSGSNSMSYTIGEPVIVTIGSSDMLTQGFQQTLPADLAVQEVSAGQWQVTAWPNPTKDNLNVSVTAMQQGFIQTELTDVAGQVVTISGNEKVIAGRNDFVLHLSQLAAGNYFLRLSSNGIVVQTIQIAKQ